MKNFGWSIVFVFFRHVLCHKCLNRIENVMWPCHFVHNAVFELTFWPCCCAGCHGNGCWNVFGSAPDVCVRADVERGGGQRNGLQRPPVEDIIWCQHHKHGGLCKWPIRLSFTFDASIVCKWPIRLSLTFDDCGLHTWTVKLSLFYETVTKETIVSVEGDLWVSKEILMKSQEKYNVMQALTKDSLTHLTERERERGRERDREREMVGGVHQGAILYFRCGSWSLCSAARGSRGFPISF